MTENLENILNEEVLDGDVAVENLDEDTPVVDETVDNTTEEIPEEGETEKSVEELTPGDLGDYVDPDMMVNPDEEVDPDMMVEPEPMPVHEPDPYKVYAKADEAGRIISVNSSMFITPVDGDGWVLIDEGFEYPKYPHAQANYLTEPGLYTEDGFCNYKLVKADTIVEEVNDETEEVTDAVEEKKQYEYAVVLRTEEEIETDKLPLEYNAQIAELKAQLAASDYKAIKYAEGWISEEEYAPIRAERQELRDQINEMEISLLSL